MVEYKTMADGRLIYPCIKSRSVVIAVVVVVVVVVVVFVVYPKY